MQKGTNWGGDYSRFSFDELKRYYLMLKEQGKGVLDDEFNVLQEILLTLLRRIVIDSFGNGAIGDGFKIVGTGAANDFTIKGGDGTASGAGRIYESGYRVILPSDTTYSGQETPGPALTTPAGPRTDKVYLDIWLDEVGPAGDAEIIDPVLGMETSRRLKLYWQVKVTEGGATPAAYVDANNRQHYTRMLATLNRTAQAAIDAGMVVDERPLLRSMLEHETEHQTLITASGQTYNNSDDTQLLEAIKRFAGNHVTVVTAAQSPKTLTIADAGLVVIDASAGNVTINLPAANALASVEFEFIRIDSTAANTATVQRAGADTVDGAATSFVLQPNYDRYRMKADGASKWLHTLPPNGSHWPSFSAHKSGTDQTGVASGVPTKVTFPVEAFDTHGYFDTATGRFMPKVPGKYQINGVVTFQSAALNAAVYCIIFKNGVAHKLGCVTRWGNMTGAAALASSVAVVVEANGTDYFELYAYQDTGANNTITGVASDTHFSGARVG